MRTDYKIILRKYDDKKVYNPATGKVDAGKYTETTVYANYTLRPSTDLLSDGHADARVVAVIRSLSQLPDFDEAVIGNRLFVSEGRINFNRHSYYVKWTGEYVE